jgi:hypothetical protein
MSESSYDSEASMTNRDKPPLVARIEELAESGDYEGLNAVLGALSGEFDAAQLEAVKQDVVFRHRIIDLCYESWRRKRSPRAH